MKCEIEIEIEDLAKELVQHVSVSELASELADHIDLDDLASKIEASHIAEHICVEDVASNIDFDNSEIAEHINYSDLEHEISYSDLAEELDYSKIEVNQFEVASALQEQDTFKKIVDDAVTTALVSKVEELAQAIASKLQTVEKKDNEELKNAIILALAKL